MIFVAELVQCLLALVNVKRAAIHSEQLANVLEKQIVLDYEVYGDHE